MSFERFPKREHLKSRKLIETLFRSGKAFSVFPVRVIYQVEHDSRYPFPIAGFSVSKKSFKKAVDRNRIKRLLRETYRLQKAALTEALQEKKQGISIFFIYTGKELPVYHHLFSKMAVTLDILKRRLEEEHEEHQ